MSWYAIGGSYSQSVKGNPGIFEEPFRIKNITEFVIKRQKFLKDFGLKQICNVMKGPRISSSQKQNLLNKWITKLRSVNCQENSLMPPKFLYRVSHMEMFLLNFWEESARGPLSIRKISKNDKIGTFSRLSGSILCGLNSCFVWKSCQMATLMHFVISQDSNERIFFF